MRTILTFLVGLGLFACAARSSSLKPEGVVSANRSGLPFIEDDYGRALREAQAKKVPIFIDAWAPW